jgi:hypothetical protein
MLRIFFFFELSHCCHFVTVHLTNRTMAKAQKRMGGSWGFGVSLPGIPESGGDSQID